MIYKELTFTYLGKRCTFTPSMALVGRIRSQVRAAGTSFVELARGVQGGDPDHFTMAYVLQEMLASAGEAVAEDACFAFLQSGGNGKGAELQSVYLAFLNTVFPEVDHGKKPDAPEAKETEASQQT